jgi:hypothetical protein
MDLSLFFGIFWLVFEVGVFTLLGISIVVSSKKGS